MQRTNAILFFCFLQFTYLMHSAPSASGELPNFVVIFVDDMGYADPGCFGNPLVKTPNIDKLASEGIKLTNFYVNSPICSASRVALTTGQYQGRWKIHSFLNTRAGNANRDMRDYLAAEAPTTAKKLKQAGYATAHFGKWHMGGGRDVDDAPLPQAYGFDESLVSFEGLGDRIISNPKGVERAKALGHGAIIPCKRWEKIKIQTDRTIDFIKRHQDQPFYVRLFPNDVHDRHDPSPGSAEKYKKITSDPFVQNFLAVLEELDRQIGRLVHTIDNLGLGENTLILFTSDNGPTDWPNKYKTGPPAGFTGPFHGRKWSLFEGGIRMPFIARWKGKIPAGITDNSSIISAIDVSPSLCRLAGVTYEEDLDGLDRSEVLLGQSSDRTKPVFWQYGHPHAILKGGKPEHQSPTFAMRHGQWKFLINPDGSEAQLFDLLADPSEQKNLFKQEPARVQNMQAEIALWAHQIGFEFEAKAKPTAPGPTIAVNTSNQLLRFENQGVDMDQTWMKFDGSSWLDLPAFRAPKVAGGRSIQIKGTLPSKSGSGVILAHGEQSNGYSLYVAKGQLSFTTLVNGRRSTIQGPLPDRPSIFFEANWQPNGDMILKMDKKLIARSKSQGILNKEPEESMQIGADLGKTVGEYPPGFMFKGALENLSFRYPNGT